MPVMPVEQIHARPATKPRSQKFYKKKKSTGEIVEHILESPTNNGGGVEF